MSVEQTIKNAIRKSGSDLRKVFTEYMNDNTGQKELLDAVELYEKASQKMLRFEELAKEFEADERADAEEAETHADN